MNLRKLLADKGMTQSQLSRKMGVSPTVINRWCTGLRHPSLSSAYKISKILGISSIDELIEG